MVRTAKSAPYLGNVGQEEAVDRAMDLLERIAKEDREAVKALLYVPPQYNFQKR